MNRKNAIPRVNHEHEEAGTKPKSQISIGEAINRTGTGKFQIILWVIVGLCFSADATEVILLSFLSAELKEEWELSSGQTAMITSSVFAGEVLGCLILGYLGDKIGRRPVFIIAATIISVFGVATALAWNFPTLILVRALCGFGIGGLNVPFDILAEFLTKENRGSYLMSVEYFWTFGSIFVPAVAYYSLDKLQSWKLFVILCAIPCIVSLLGALLFVPESPRWLVSKGRNEEALMILRRVAELNGKNSHELFLENTVIYDTENKDSSNFRDLFKPQWRKKILLLWTVWFGMVFSYYGTILMITRIFTDTNDSSNQTGHATFNYEAITISASSEIIGLTIAILAVNRIGRISPAVSSFLMGGTFAVVLAFSASSKPIWFLTVIAFGARCVEMAGSSILWISTAEILPTELRSTGHGSSNAIGRIGGILAPFLIQSNISLLTVSVCMFAIHSVTALGMSLLPETKNLEVGEISLHGHETAEVCANERTSVLQNKTVLTYSTLR